MEDVRIGRGSTYNEHAETVGATAIPVVAIAQNRRSLMFSPPVAGGVTFSTKSGVTAGAGLYLAAGSHAITLTVDEHGPIVTLAWYAIADAAARVVGIFESLLDKK